ncbi:MAG: hypothetical protein NXI02_02495 [Rhodobacteraceae bacterium]|nr:ABC-type multidrug transport system fused ATPase/permease subunit [Labrenzia sp. EL_142]MCR9056180.1 hypothetical protein [Paracoccaceae bacterium]
MRNPLNSKTLNDPDGTVRLVWRLLSENYRNYLPKYGLAFVFMAMIAATTAASAWIMHDVVNEVFVNKDATMVYVIATVFLSFLPSRVQRSTVSWSCFPGSATKSFRISGGACSRT